MRLHFFTDELKADALTLLKRLRIKFYVTLHERTQTALYSCHWLWFAVSFSRDIRHTKYKDLYKENAKDVERKI